MTEPGNNQPLRNDPAREATASMAGYASQIWRSVLIWLRLEDGERLYLEGAEDIDVIHGSSAETIQVKATKRNITLRSPDVVEAIDNAWLNQQRNRDRLIRYRFLTNAEIGMEQGDPIGLGLPGIALWERARKSADEAARLADTDRIRQFLLNESRVSAAVQAFLRDTDARGIWERLIARVEWDTDAADAPEVVQEIRNILVTLGQPRGIPSKEAEKLTAQLYEAAWAVATARDGDRSLVRADAIRIFDEKTRVSLPHAALSTLLARLAQLSGGRELGTLLPLPVVGRSSSLGRAPALRTRHHSRPAVVDEIHARLTEFPRLVLYGATGTGKSTLAAEYVAAATDAWGWVDLRGVAEVALTERLTRIANDLEGEEGITNVVLDDLELPADSRQVEAPIATISRIIGSRAGRLIITSTAALPQRLTLELSLRPRSSYQVPAFTRTDIEEFLRRRGCPSEKLIGQWAALIELHTLGHPQLVHARIAALENLGFPSPTTEDVTATPPDVIEARTEARRLVALLDAPAREFVYRLSLTSSIFQRKQIISIANQDPAITEPGLAFDKVVGPWMERIGEDLYRISPLIRNAGSEVQGEAWTTRAHSAIAWGLLAVRTLTPYDASAILLHGIASRDWVVIAYLCRGILNADGDTWFALAEAASWFVFVGIREGVAPLNADPFSLFLIRTLQYRLAAAGKRFDAARRVLAAFHTELPPGQTDEALRLARHFFLSQVLWRSEVPLSVADIIATGAEYLTLNDSLSDILRPGFREIPHHVLQGPDGSFDAVSVVGFTLSSRIDDRPSVGQLLDACESLPPATLRRLLWFIGGTEGVASLMFFRAIVWENQQAQPDWAAVRDLALRAYAKARDWGLPGLAQAAAYWAAKIIDEHLEGRDEALCISDKLAAEIGWSPAQEDGRAAIFLRAGQFAEALEIWRRILPNWQPQSELDLQAQFSCRDAAIAAERLGQWAEAGDWLADARRRTGEGANPKYEAALLIDEGYARWKAGDLRAALSRFAEGITALEKLPSDDMDEGAYILRKRAGHTLMWVTATTNGTPTGSFAEPPPACCSSLNPVTGPREPSTPHDIMWAYLTEFELGAHLGDEVLREYEARLVSSPFGVVRANFGFIRVKHRLAHLMLGDLIEVGASLADATEIYRRYYREGQLGGAVPLPPDAVMPTITELPTDIVLSVLISGMFAAVAQATLSTELLRKWRSSATGMGLSPKLVAWVDLAQSLFITGSVDGQAAMRDTSLGWEGQVLATLRVATDDAARPADLLTAHVCWVNTLRNIGKSLLPTADIEYLVTVGWQRLSERTFLLRMPLTTVPDLKRACASDEHGWRKVGEVLAAAQYVVPGTVSQTMRDTICSLLANN
jgi:hypothetical protein